MKRSMKSYFISGLVVFLPVALTIYLFFLAISFADNLLGQFLRPYFDKNFGFYFSGISILIGIALIIGIGFFVTNFLGKKIYDFFENLLIRLPFFKQVYPALKEMAMFLFSQDRMRSFQQVVLVPYPRYGAYSIGFLMNESSKKICDAVGQEMLNVFVPSAPGPMTGFVIIFPKAEVIHVDITVEQAFKLIMSGGVVNPEKVK